MEERLNGATDDDATSFSGFTEALGDAGVTRQPRTPLHAGLLRRVINLTASKNAAMRFELLKNPDE